MWFFLVGCACTVYALVSTSAVFGGAAVLAAVLSFLAAYFALQGGAQ